MYMLPPIKPIEFPHVYESVSPIEGRIKHRHEDFVVDERLAYPLCGEGEHLYVRIEKRGWSMERLLQHFRATLDLGQTQIGYAGMKDKLAVTRQWFSFPASCAESLDRIDCSSVKVLEQSRHTNKLRTGHLTGNHFGIMLRGASAGRQEDAATLLDAISRNGMINVYGNQRFGKEYESVRVGRDILVGHMNASAMSRMKRKFSISAIQSYLFNSYILRRLELGILDTVIQGDILKRRDSGGLFIAEDTRREQARLDAHEIVLTGPMYGRKMKSPADRSLELEHEVMIAAGLRPGSFDAFHTLGSGTRRPVRIYPTEGVVTANKDGIRLEFFLPKGAYATVLLRELVKRDV
jgi:tRNA pseudouridine13 synthase